MPYYRGTLRFSSAILLGYPLVLNCYTIAVPLDPQLLYYRGTLRSSTAILLGYAQVINFTIGDRGSGSYSEVRFYIRPSHWLRSQPIRNELFYLKVFQHFDETLLQVIESQDSESDIRFYIRPSHWLESRPIRNELFYFKVFQHFDETLLQVIESQDFESDIRFYI